MPLLSQDGSEDQALTEQLIGAYEVCRRLLRAPQMNKPQREFIGRQADLCMYELKELGVEFGGAPNPEAIVREIQWATTMGFRS